MEEQLRQMAAQQQAAAVGPQPTGLQSSQDMAQIKAMIDAIQVLPGQPGRDAVVTSELIQEILDAATPIKGVDYRDGKDGKDGRDGRDAPTLSPDDIKGMIDALEASDMLTFENIKGLPELTMKMVEFNEHVQSNEADHVFFTQEIQEIMEWIDRVKGLKLLQSAPGTPSNVSAVTELCNIDDVNCAGKVDGSILVWNQATLQWIMGSNGTTGINAEDEGIAVGGGPFDTINFLGTNVVAVDGGGGTLDVTVTAAAGGITVLTSVDNSVTLAAIAGGYDLSVDTANIDWTTANWNDFFTNVDWSLNNWANFFNNTDWTLNNWGNFFTSFYANVNWNDFFSSVNWTDFFNNVDWSLFVDWSDFINSWVTNVTPAQWNTFIDNFIANVDTADINNWIAIWDASNFSAFIASWVANTNPSDWDVFIDAFITNVDADDVINFLNQSPGTANCDIMAWNQGTLTWEVVPISSCVTGSGASLTATANEAITLGDPVGLDSDGTFSRALRAFSTNGTNKPPIFSGSHEVINMTSINTNKYVLLYQTPTTGSNIELYSVVVTIDAATNDITYGTPQFVYDPAEDLDSAQVAKLDTDKFVITYVGNGNNDLFGIVGTVSGTVITLGVAQSLGTGTITISTCCQLDTNKFGFSSAGAGAGDRIGFATVSGTIITIVDFTTSTPAFFNDNNRHEAVKVATDKFIIRRIGTSSCVVCTTVGVTLVVGSATNTGSAGSTAWSQGGLFSVGTNEIFVVGTNSVGFCTISGTSLTIEDTTAYTAGAGSNVGEFGFSDGTDVYYMGSDGDYSRLDWSAPNLTLSLLSATAEETIVGGRQGVATDGTDYLYITTGGKFTTGGMSRNFIGVATATVTAGSPVTATTDGEATVGFTPIPGSYYTVSEGTYTQALDITGLSHPDAYVQGATSSSVVVG